MKRIDRLIVGELFGPWLFGVAMFTSLLLAATYLGRIADYVVQGLPPAKILEITFLLLPPILVKTFAMATLLGALLAFGRLSGDSEVVALRAGGASIYRIIFPVACFSFAVAVLTFMLNDTLVPNSAKRAKTMTDSIGKEIQNKKAQPTFQTIIENGQLKAMIMARDFNLGDQTLSGVTIKALDKEGHPTFFMEASKLKYQGDSAKGWRIENGATLFSADGRDYSQITGEIWPGEVPKINKDPQEMSVHLSTDPDYYTTGELREALSKSNLDKSITTEQYRNMEYWLWNKYAVPMAAFVFGVLGAALGIRSHRAGTATGFALAVAIMFAYMTLANFMNVWAMGGVIPPYVASLTPIALGLIASFIIMWRRNTG
ncbi:MAG: LptF/LptG family permease [Armatimonadetes bacterium]|nr:LptF/LptG family permease [Armatimonadota bacterium]